MIRSPRLSRAALVLLTCFILPPTAFGQDAPITLKSCGKPKVLLGVVRSAGTVAVQVDSRGRADNATIVVTDVEVGSAAGLQSALRRQLTGCTFRVKSDGHTSAWYAFTVRWNRGKLEVSQPARLAQEPLNAPDAEFSVIPLEELSVSDDRLEEAPRIVSCKLPAPETVTVYTQGGQVIRKIKEGPRDGFREATLEYVVTPEGRIEPASFIMIRGDTQLAMDYAERLATCSFAPGRVNAVPVSTRMSSTSSIERVPFPGSDRSQSVPAARDAPTDPPRPCGTRLGCAPNEM